MNYNTFYVNVLYACTGRVYFHLCVYQNFISLNMCNKFFFTYYTYNITERIIDRGKINLYITIV